MKAKTVILVVLAGLVAGVVIGLVGRDRDAMAALVGQVTLDNLVVKAQPAPSGMGLPKVTEAEKTQAVDIALKDSRIQQLLAGKKYVVAPDGGAGPQIGLWHQGTTKLGVAFVIRFDRAYDMEYDWPVLRWRDEARTGFVTERRPQAGRVRAILVCVNLYVDTQDGSIVDIRPM